MQYKNLIVLLGMMLFSTSTSAAIVSGPLVDTKWLAKNMTKVVILDARKDTKSFTAKPVFKKEKKTGKLKLVRVGGHIPGAALVNYKNVRATRIINGKKVTRMIPEIGAFEKLMQNAGVGKNSAIVIVSKGESHADMTIATRLYWQLKYYGQEDMAVLDGGMAQWLNEGRKFSIAKAPEKKGDWKATTENTAILATSEDVVQAIKDGGTQLVDARPLTQYFGTFYKKSYVYKKGHIPGAKSFPIELLTDATAPAKFTNVKDLKTLAKELGVNTDKGAITYCNSGHLASGTWFVMSEIMGNKNAKLYDGSMHQWTLEKHPTTVMKRE